MTALSGSYEGARYRVPLAAETDAALLAAVPDFVSLGTLAKARASSEDGQRLLYFEASNEDVDHQGEVVLQKALGESSDYYLRHGNIDLSHYTVIGAKLGIPNHLEYEVGRPVEVRVDGRKTFVKAQLYHGDSAMARHADVVWDSLTKQSPPAQWYASVGGAVLGKSIRVDPKTNERVAVIDKVRWNNTALDRCPVNKTVSGVSATPIGVFAKSLGGFVLAKDLSAGYGTDSATLTGGAALREQSLDHKLQSYWDFRDRIAGAIRRGECGGSARDIVEHAHSAFGVGRADAAKWTERFLADLRSGLQAKKRIH